MATLDIRDEEYDEITDIRFDDSSDRITWNEFGVYFCYASGEIKMCSLENLDNLVKALYKAKELAGK